MTTRLQRDMLLLLMALTIPLSVFYGAQFFHEGWVAHTKPAAVFVVHTLNSVAIVLLAAYFLHRRRVAGAWACVIGLSFASTLVQIWLLHEPGLILFVLLALAGPAIAMPLSVSGLLIGGLVAAVILLARFTFPTAPASWSGIVILFVAIMLGFCCIGGVIRRFVWRFAQTTVEIEQAAAQRGTLEQQMRDLRRQVMRIASLEHDLRQPLRVVQGYLSTLAAEAPRPACDDLILPAQAAVQRADRLMNNLLDQARAEANEQQSLPTAAVDTAALFTELQQSAPGLAAYYTDPPVPIHFHIRHPLPKARVDHEQLGRAVLNLLDNALAYSPPDGKIEVRAWGTDEALFVEVQDMGPGIPVDVVQALLAGETVSSQNKFRLGLRQACNMAQWHGGDLSFISTGPGTTVRITLPTRGA
jgi:signal transduction histidine kinase